MKCTRNLTKHIQLLKTQQNKILTLHLNGYKIPNEMKQEFVKHYRYTKKLFNQERYNYYNNLLQTDKRL